MQIIVCGTESLKQELLQQGVQPGCNIQHVSSVEGFLEYSGANAFIHFSFDNMKEELELLRQLKGLVIINSVTYTLAETDAFFIRINGWPGFLNSIIEGSCLKEGLKTKAEKVFEQFNKTVEWLPDEPGFITCRVVSMIINEGYFALEEEVSTKEQMDEAMKLGTAYPYGPFEWAKKIGLRNVVQLLTRLTKEKTRYAPAPLLVQEAEAAKG
jgi:3-hydroxybutyryl-CoA dehydrogenase